VWPNFECCLPENFIDRDIASHNKRRGIKFARYSLSKVWKVWKDGPFFGSIFLWGDESRINNHSIKVGEAVHIRKPPNCNRNVTVSLDHPKNLLQSIFHLEHGSGSVHGTPFVVAGKRSLDNKEVAMEVEASDAWTP
jgi:hypothetical protein